MNEAVSTAKKKSLAARNKNFTAGFYLAGFSAFIGYILISIILRIEFEMSSAYDMSINGDALLGIGVALIMNFSVMPLLMMAYFYKKDNGKHNIFLVFLYIAFLVCCFIDGILPYMDPQTNDLMEEVTLFDVLLYPTVFLVLHRVLSLLLYLVIHKKEGTSDYKIYYGMVLFGPILAWMLIIAIIFWLFQAVSDNDGYSYSNSHSDQPIDIKDSVRDSLSVGIRTYGVYYDDGWKVVDYWNNTSKLSEVITADWRNTYLEDSSGKIYVLTTNCPDKETVYYFDK